MKNWIRQADFDRIRSAQIYNSEVNPRVVSDMCAVHAVDFHDYLEYLKDNPIYIVHMLRGGAPDKMNTPGLDDIIIRHDRVNLVDFSKEEILKYKEVGEFILPADEGDITYLESLGIDAPNVLLPMVNKKLMSSALVHKNSEAYANINTHCEHVKYMEYFSYDISDLKTFYNAVNECCKDVKTGTGVFKDGFVIKTTIGSGSRGIYCVSPTLAEQGIHGYHASVTKADLKELVKFAKEEFKKDKRTKLMIQKFIPASGRKVNVDFVIRKGKLLGYKWDFPEPGSNFTNWNWLEVVRDDMTDMYMKEIETHLCKHIGITDAIMNFEACLVGDMLYLVEFNWRYSNSSFESHAFNIDLIGCCIRNKKFRMPKGVTRVCRSWVPVIDKKVKGYRIGK